MNKLISLLVLLSVTSCVPTSYDDLEETALEFQDNSRTPSSKNGYSSVSNLEARMGDRYYIASVLKDVFGPNYNSGSRVYTNIIRQQGVFGGPCDLYERSLKGENTRSVENAWHQCFDPNWNTSVNLKSTTLREGWRMRACELIIAENTSAVSYAFNKANVDRSSNVSYAKLNNVFKLFYPLENLPSSTYDEMSAWESEVSSQKDFWEASLLAFCITPGWQIP